MVTEKICGLLFHWPWTNAWGLVFCSALPKDSSNVDINCNVNLFVIYYFQDEKYLILKRHSNEQSPMTSPEPSLSYSSSFTSLLAAGPHSPSMDSLSSIPGTSKHHPPPYRSPPPVLSPTMQHPPGMCISRTSSDSSVEKTPPPVPPRRRSSEKLKLSNKENEQEDVHRGANLTSDDSEVKILFNRFICTLCFFVECIRLTFLSCFQFYLFIYLCKAGCIWKRALHIADYWKNFTCPFCD